MSNIFKKPADGIYHSGKGNGVIENGDSQTIVNEKLSKAIKDLQDSRLSNRTNSDIDTKSITNVSKISVGEEVSIHGSYPLDVIPTDTNIGVSYDITSLVGEKNARKRVSIIGTSNGVTKELVNSNKTINTITLPPDAFPIEVNVEVENLNGTEREKITGGTYLRGVRESLSETAYKRSTGISELKTQDDINISLDKRIKDVYKRIPVRETVVIDGEELSLPNAIKKVMEEAGKETPEKELEYTRNGSTRKDNIQNIINEIFLAIENNTRLIENIINS